MEKLGMHSIRNIVQTFSDALVYFIFMIIIITNCDDDYRSLDDKIRTIQQNKSGNIF